MNVVSRVISHMKQYIVLTKYAHIQIVSIIHTFTYTHTLIKIHKNTHTHTHTHTYAHTYKHLLTLEHKHTSR